MGFMDLFRRPPPQKQEPPQKANTIIAQSSRDVHRNRYGGSKYGPLSFNTEIDLDPESLRVIARQIYRESLEGRGIIRRLVDNCINIGLTWESAPLWEEIPDAPGEEDQYAFTRRVENYWRLYSDTKEADIRGELTARQLQRRLFQLALIEGEFFVILRYLNDPKRISPIAQQVLNNDQIMTPYDMGIQSAVKARGGKIEHGIEYDSVGKAIAIWTKEGIGKDPVRISFFGPKSNRRFVVHYTNAEGPGQVRGVPELSALCYELSRMTEYEIAEIENAVASALWMGVVTADKDAAPKKPSFVPATQSKDTSEKAPKVGIEIVEIQDRSLIMNNLPPGYKFEAFAPTHPNQNYEKFVEVVETRICASLGMPLSVYTQKFETNYSASRAAMVFFWNSVVTRRDDFVSGYLSEFHEAVFSEWEKSGVISAPGFDTTLIRRAWLYGSWNGISRPSVDPMKEVTAVEKRTRLGHTTGEREAKAYNGSDFRENVDRLNEENPLLADANKTLAPPSKQAPKKEKGDDEDE